ncbi:MAG TPA: hypothetical protein VGV89_06980 [Thermoplasmata archaeon]|nr:hypothetical protein [Thermoplasmata archaeon]
MFERRGLLVPGIVLFATVLGLSALGMTLGAPVAAPALGGVHDARVSTMSAPVTVVNQAAGPSGFEVYNASNGSLHVSAVTLSLTVPSYGCAPTTSVMGVELFLLHWNQSRSRFVHDFVLVYMGCAHGKHAFSEIACPATGGCTLHRKFFSSGTSLTLGIALHGNKVRLSATDPSLATGFSKGFTNADGPGVGAECAKVPIYNASTPYPQPNYHTMTMNCTLTVSGHPVGIGGLGSAGKLFKLTDYNSSGITPLDKVGRPTSATIRLKFLASGP